MTTQNLKYIGIVGCALAIIGAFLVWATISAGPLSVDVKGTDEGKDGTITLILAIIAAASIWFVDRRSWVIWVALAASVLFLLVGLYDTVDIMGESGEEVGGEILEVDVSVGIGLWMTDLGGILATGAAAMLKMNASKAGTVLPA
jgi:hypothetical protein